MTTERALQLLRIEQECIKRNSCEGCDRDCAACDLVQEDEELNDMYEYVTAYFPCNTWIDVNTRLPLEHQDILIYCTNGEDGRIVASNYADNEWWDCINGFGIDLSRETVTHWMPLPPRPEGY